MIAVAPVGRPGRLTRVLRLEIRRSAVPWAIPLIAALFFFDAYRTAAGYPPIWSVRASGIPNHVLFDFTAFAAGLGAMFMGGVTLAMLGLLALAPVLPVSYRDWLSAIGRAGRWLCVAGAALLAVGVAAASTAFALAGTAKQDVAGMWEIPALHDAASDQPLAYTPACSDIPEGRPLHTPPLRTGTPFKVCVHPAFGGFLADVASALDPVAAEIAGLPGAPVGAREVATGAPGPSAGNPIAGNPLVFTFTADNVGNLIGTFRGSPAGTDAIWRTSFQQALLDAFVTGQPPAGLPDFAGVATNPARQAVVNALLTAIGTPASQLPQPAGPGGQTGPGGRSAQPSVAQIAAAAQRFATLPPAARHAWLAAHLPALRAGQITLAQLP